MNQEVALLRERLETLAADYAEGLVTREQLVKATATIRGKLEAKEAELGPVESESWGFDLEYLYEEVDDMHPEERREWLRSVTESVRLHRRGRGRSKLHPGLVEVEMPSFDREQQEAPAIH